MESTFNAGQLVKVIYHLQSPHGLCLSQTEGTVFVADGHTIRQIELETKSVGVIAKSFQQAFDVALSSNGDLGVTDVQAHKIMFLQQEPNGTYKRESLRLEEEKTPQRLAVHHPVIIYLVLGIL